MALVVWGLGLPKVLKQLQEIIDLGRRIKNRYAESEEIAANLVSLQNKIQVDGHSLCLVSQNKDLHFYIITTRESC